jgi:MFS family permease
VSRAEILRHRPLRALLAAEVISSTGTQMTWLALPWFVLVTSGSAARMTIVMAVALLGFAAASLPSGPLLHRLGARRTMLLADAARAPLMLLVPVLHWSGDLTYAPLVVLALLLGMLGAPFFTAQRVILPELLGEDERTVGQANALFQGAIRTTLLLGPPLAGVLIGVFGATTVLVIDAGTYVVSFLLVALFVPSTERAPRTEESRGLLSGFRFIGRDRLLRVWMPLFLAGDAGWQAFFAAVPVLVVERFGADAKIAGLLFGAFGAGSLCGNIVSFRFLTERIDGLRLVALSVPFQAAPLWLLTFDVGAGVLFFAVLASGVANGICNPSIHTIMTLRMPPALRPQATAAMGTLWGIGQPLGLLLAGPVLVAFGPEPVLVAFAAIQTVTMLGVSSTSLRARARAPEPVTA